jgi:hypothetical protein
MKPGMLLDKDGTLLKDINFKGIIDHVDDILDGMEATKTKDAIDKLKDNVKSTPKCDSVECSEHGMIPESESSNH